MNRTLRILCAALFLGTTACSLVLSASSTLAKAHAVHVPGGAVWSAVGVLEMVSLAATLRWLTATTRRGQVEAWVISGLVLLVTGVAGCAAYGWFGLVAPTGVVACVYMVHATLADAKAAEDAAKAEAYTEVIVVPTNPEPDPTPTDTMSQVDLLRLQAQKLLAENPKIGRGTLARELDVKPNVARNLLDELRPVRAVEESA